jgi:hypothetical protein
MTFNCSHNPISSVKLILSTTQNVYLFLSCVVKTKRFFMFLCFKSVWSGCNKFPSKTLISAFLLKIVCLIAEKEIMQGKIAETNIVEKEIIEIKIIFFVRSLYIYVLRDWKCRASRWTTISFVGCRWTKWGIAEVIYYRIAVCRISAICILNYVTSGDEGVHTIYLICQNMSIMIYFETADFSNENEYNSITDEFSINLAKKNWTKSFPSKSH